MSSNNEKPLTTEDFEEKSYTVEVGNEEISEKELRCIALHARIISKLPKAFHF